jgi:E3 ubiquitin-protein ligase UHRF1
MIEDTVMKMSEEEQRAATKSVDNEMKAVEADKGGDVVIENVSDQEYSITADTSKIGAGHRGDIPEIFVGQLFKFRQLVANYLVHRAPQSGICGSVKHGGAVSIVLAGVGKYGNKDNGIMIEYVGCGPDGIDQKLEGFNRALAMTCAAKENPDGARAEDWKQSKPIRVVRGYPKDGATNDYAPATGYRYDGVYKVKAYTLEHSGKGGSHKIYRFHLERDDTTQPPWTDEGKERVKSLNLKTVTTGGYREPSEKKTKKTKKPKKVGEVGEGEGGEKTEKDLKEPEPAKPSSKATKTPKGTKAVKSGRVEKAVKAPAKDLRARETDIPKLRKRPRGAETGGMSGET